MSINLKIAILCGGYGKRLRPYTENIPKPLILLDDRPILDHILRLYEAKGYKDIILCIGYKGEKIREFIDGFQFDGSITFSDAGEDASMLSRITKLKDLFSEQILVSYGDTMTDLDIDDFYRFHSSNKASATIVTAAIQSPFGLVKFDDDASALSFDEKPMLNYYIGHILIEKEAINNIDERLLQLPDGEGLVRLFQGFIREKKLYVYHYNGPQITFNSHSERSNAEKMLEAFYTVVEEG